MPKKRTHQFKATTQRSQPSSSSTGSSRTINERLSQLRAEQAPRATLEQRNNIASIGTSHTLPPHLRRLLDLPETLPPAPKPGNRRLMRINGRRPPPGPAAPRSWLAASLHAPADVQVRAKRLADSRWDRQIPETFVRLACLEGPHEMPAVGSLLDQALKSMAMHWTDIVEYEQYNLATLPIRWKTVLLSYLSVYGPEEGINTAELKTLFLVEDELAGGTGGEDLIRLDLTGLISGGFSLVDLSRFLYRKLERHEDLPTSLDALSLNEMSTKSPSNVTSAVNAAVAESWEDEAISLILVPGIRIQRFPNLTRLSLADAGVYASWAQLLGLSTHLATLTHLSLANWPVPTTTPNSKTAFITHNHASIPVSGTHFYSEMDEDWAEAASILKRLSNNTYRLQWLDLEGCFWLPALTWHDGERGADRWIDRTFRRPRFEDTPLPRGLFFDSEETTSAKPNQGPDWTGSWAQLVYVNVSQGAIPRSVSAVRTHPASRIAAELLLWLRDESHQGDETQESKRIDIPSWLQREKEARAVATMVRALRSSMGGAFCEFDHGWTRPVAAAAVALKGKKDDELS